MASTYCNYFEKFQEFEVPITSLPTSFSLLNLKDFELLKQELSDMESYALQFSDETTKMYLKKIDPTSSSLQRCRYHGYLPNLPAEQVYHALRDHKSRYEWDMRNLGRRILDVYKVDGHPVNVVEHFTKKGVFTVSNRDFVTLNSELRERKSCGSEQVLMLGKSIEYHKAPPNDDFVRGEIIYSGILIEKDPKDSNSSHVTVISEMDLKGWIPSWLYNWGLQYLPKEFEQSIQKAVSIRMNKSDATYKNFYQEV